MKVLVTGGTGNVGGAVVKELLARGASVRVLARKQPEAGKLPAGAELAIGDMLDPVSIEKAMQGIDKLFLLNAVVTDELTQALITYDIAKRAGLKHVTYLSVFKVEEFRDVPHFASKLAVESAIREFGIPSTILRPGYYMQNDATLKDALTGPGVYPHPIAHEIPRSSRDRICGQLRSCQPACSVRVPKHVCAIAGTVLRPAGPNTGGNTAADQVERGTRSEPGTGSERTGQLGRSSHTGGQLRGRGL